MQILPYHIAEMPHELIRLALVLLKPENRRKFLSVTEGSPQKLLGLLFLLWWFCVNDRINGIKHPSASAAEDIIETFQNGECIPIEKMFAQCVYKEWLVPPISPDTLKNCDINSHADDIENALADLRKGMTFDWEESKNFVLLACGKYLVNSFPDAGHCSEDNRPWDYDHFLPQAKAEKSTEKLCWSSGNNVPIALTVNRTKQDSFPDKNYPDNSCKNQELLYLNLEPIDEIFPDAEHVDSDEFNSFAWERYCAMYERVYTAFGWDDFANAKYGNNTGFAEKAKALTAAINNQTERKYRWYYALDGRDFPVGSDDDFDRFRFFILRDSEDRCFAVETSDFENYSTYGKRKSTMLPVGRGVGWWDDSENREGLTAEEAINFLIRKTAAEKQSLK